MIVIVDRSNPRKVGVQVNLYVSPRRSVNGVAQIEEHRISFFRVEPQKKRCEWLVADRVENSPMDVNPVFVVATVVILVGKDRVQRDEIACKRTVEGRTVRQVGFLTMYGVVVAVVVAVGENGFTRTRLAERIRGHGWACRVDR